MNTVCLHAHVSKKGKRNGVKINKGSEICSMFFVFCSFIYVKYKKTFKNEQRNRDDTAPKKS